MKRSVYSLVLMDDVIKAVDEQAYRLGRLKRRGRNLIGLEPFQPHKSDTCGKTFVRDSGNENA